MLKKTDRPFSCDKCLVHPQTKELRDTFKKLRRCEEDRFDFTEEDNPNVFPIQISPGGPQFGFCPAKIRRDDHEAAMIYQVLNAILETGTWPKIGGIEDQDEFWVDLVATFGPFRRSMEFQERYSLVAKGIANGLGKNKAGGGNRGAVKKR